MRGETAIDRERDAQDEAGAGRKQFPRLLSGHSLAAQKPGEIKVFWLLFFKKVTASFTF